MNKKIILEFIGMPGSGKTFYQKKIVKILKNEVIANNFNKFNKLKKFQYIILFIRKHPIFFFKTIILLINNLLFFKDFKKHLYYFYNEIAFRSFFDYQKKKLILINSEGFAYRSAFYFRNNFNHRTEDYIKKIPKIDLLIFVHTNKKIDVERTRERKKGYKYSKKENINYYKKLFYLKKVLKIFKNNNTKLIIIDNKNINLSKKNIKKILKHIKNENSSYQ
jgi:thymidylate kinase